LLLKESSSTGIMDTFFAVTERELNKEKIIDAVDQVIKAYKNKVELPAENLPIIIDQSTLTRLFLRDLNGKMVGNKASLFQEQFNKKLFSENFNLRIANNPQETFSPEFDLEGSIVEPENQVLIDSGVIKRPYTDKRTAHKYGFENTGCAGGAYDSIPALRPCHLEIVPGNKSLKSLLNGKKGILIGIASGGDFTSDGRFASPVQVAYLTDGEKLLGRLPEITISGSIFDFFADDFVGVSSDKIYVAGDERLAVVNLKVDKL
jgi:PmbA protein